jgi:F0F1-type ATP synthase membrane subunit a
MSGHSLLKILIGFSWVLLNTGSVDLTVSLIPWLIVIMITILELVIACLQAYVFLVLVSIYLGDVINLH